VIGLLVIVVGGAGSLWWLFAASFGEKRIADAIARAESAGWRVRYAGIERSGFPLALNWRLSGIAIERAGRHRIWQGTVPLLEVDAKPWVLNRLDFRTPLPQSWQVLPPAGGAPLWQVQVVSAKGQIAPPPDASGFRTVLTLVGVEVRDSALLGSVPEMRATLTTPLDRSRLDFDLAVLAVEWTPATPVVQRASDIRLTGRMMPLLTGIDAVGLDAWQTAGGQLRLERTEASLGGMRVTGNGRFALDGERRLAGYLLTKTDRPVALVRILQAEGVLRGIQASMAEGIVQALPQQVTATTTTTFDNGVAAVTADLGLLKLGPFPLFTLSPLGQ